MIVMVLILMMVSQSIEHICVSWSSGQNDDADDDDENDNDDENYNDDENDNDDDDDDDDDDGDDNDEMMKPRLSAADTIYPCELPYCHRCHHYTDPSHCLLTHQNIYDDGDDEGDDDNDYDN